MIKRDNLNLKKKNKRDQKQESIKIIVAFTICNNKPHKASNEN